MSEGKSIQREHVGKELGAGKDRAVTDGQQGAQRAAAHPPNELDRAACDQFVYLVSHELRGPLATLIGYAQLLGREALPAPLKSRAVESVLRNAKRLNVMIENLLQASRIASGKLQIERQPVTIVELLERVIAAYRPPRTVELSVTEGPLVTVGDASLLALAIDNIVSNAAKFSPEAAPIRVDASRSDGTIVIAIEDAGSGIPGEDVARIFEPYQPKPTGSKPGLGVGLYVARGIVEAHNGSIAVSSTPGKGSTISISLPVGRP